MIEIEITSPREMKKAASLLAKEVLMLPHQKALVIALTGELGAGKTTFSQGFAAALSVRERVASPTFVLMKIYQLSRIKKFSHFVHIDSYRLRSPQDLLDLGFKKILEDPKAIILIEWADRIKKIIPAGALWLSFSHGKHQKIRHIRI